MILLQVVEDKPYFVWQLYVQMLNFRDWDIEQDAVILVAAEELSDEMKKFKDWTSAKVYNYPDTRLTRQYLSSIRPHLIEKYMLDVGEPDMFFYHDQDIIFISKPRFNELAEGEYNYVSENANSYLQSGYIKQFKKYIFPSMCELVDVSMETVEKNDPHCGGAQYVLKGTDWKFWHKMERDCEALFTYLIDVSHNGLRKYKPDQTLDAHLIQMWTSDMWAILWNLWRLGKETRYSASIDFSFPWELRVNERPIFHNSGIASNNEFDQDGKPKYFNKSRYMNSYPYKDDFSFVSNRCCQSYYIHYIRRISEMMG